jgi:hypothetical protein
VSHEPFVRLGWITGPQRFQDGKVLVDNRQDLRSGRRRLHEPTDAHGTIGDQFCQVIE